MQPKAFKEGKTPVELGVPYRTISIDLTEGCSLRCDYCFCDIHAEKKMGNNLTEERGKEIIDWFLQDDVTGKPDDSQKTITWWGGEPFTKYSLMKTLTEYAINKAKIANKKVSFSATTNMTVLNREKLEWAMNNRFQLLFSIDGRDERNKHRKMPNGKNSWEILKSKVDLVIDVFKQYKVRPTFRSTISPDVIEGLASDVIWMHEKCNVTPMISENYDAKWKDDDFVKYKKELSEIYDFTYNEFKRKGTLINIRNTTSMITDYIKRGIDPSIHKSGKYPCGAGRGFIGVSVEGAISPCHRCNKHNTLDKSWHDKDYNLGSIYENITNLEVHDLFNNKLIHGSYEESIHNKCKTCPVLKYCDGVCVAVNKDNTGKWEEIPETWCKILMMKVELSVAFTHKLMRDGLFRKFMSCANINLIENTTNKNCTCYSALYSDYTSEVRDKVIGKHIDNDELKLLVMAKDIIDDQINKIEVPMLSKNGCTIHNSIGEFANKSAHIKNKKEMLKQIAELIE